MPPLPHANYVTALYTCFAVLAVGHARDIPAHFAVDYLPSYHCTLTLLYWLSGMQEMYWHNLLLIINLSSSYSCLW